MIYSKTCEYSIRALACLALQPPGCFLRISELSDLSGISTAYLAKICRGLVHKQLLRSKPGAQGGVGLAEKAQDISLMEIVNTVQDCALFERCVMGLSDCSDVNPCPLHPVWKHAKEEMIVCLSNAKLKDVAHKIKNLNYASFTRSQLKGIIS